MLTDTLPCLSSAHVIHGDMNSCGSVHGCSGGVVHVDAHGVMHANLSGAVVHRNSCNSHGTEVLGRRKPLMMSTRRIAWRRKFA